MLSIASSQLRIAAGVTQKAPNGGRVNHSRLYSTDAPKKDSGAGKSSGGDGAKRSQRAYTYKQAYESANRYESKRSQQDGFFERRRDGLEAISAWMRRSNE